MGIDIIKKKAVYCLPLGILYQAFDCTAKIDDINDDKVELLCMCNSDANWEFTDVSPVPQVKGILRMLQKLSFLGKLRLLMSNLITSVKSPRD